MKRQMRIIKLLLGIISGVMLSGEVPAQNQREIDSLVNLLESVKYDTARVNLYNKIFSAYGSGDSAKAMEYYGKALRLAQKINYATGIADAYHFLGCYYDYRSEYAQSLGYLQKAIQVYAPALENAKSRNEVRLIKTGISSCYNHIGIIHYFQGDYQVALEYY
jgi:tetratricopeptide (TPR) repeat protein